MSAEKARGMCLQGGQARSLAVAAKGVVEGTAKRYVGKGESRVEVVHMGNPEGASLLYARVSRPPQSAISEPVWLGFRKLHVFDKETGLRARTVS
jgi:hypothetical protein